MPRTREAVRGFARRETVKAEELHEEARTASRAVSVRVAVSVAMRVCSCWRRVSAERIVWVNMKSMMVAVAHLRRERTTARTHETVPAEVRHFERSHLPCDLEGL